MLLSKHCFICYKNHQTQAVLYNELFYYGYIDTHEKKLWDTIILNSSI